MSIQQISGFNYFILFFCVYVFATLSATISERAGIRNLALEGMMIVGATTWALLMQKSNYFFSWEGPMGYGGTYMAIIVAGLVAMVVAFLYNFLVVNLFAHQTMTGLAFNLFVSVLALFLIEWISGQSSITTGYFNLANRLPTGASGDAGWSGIIDSTALVYLFITIATLGIIWFVLSKTVFGIRLKSSGENPYVLDSMGISIAKIRWKAMMLASFLAGVGGAMIVGTQNTFFGVVDGAGYIALALVILAHWRPVGVFFFSSIMAVFFAWVLSTDWTQVGLSRELMRIIPFMVPLLLMIYMKITTDKKLTKRAWEIIYIKKYLSKPDNKKINIYLYKVWRYFVFILYWSWISIPVGLTYLSRYIKNMFAKNKKPMVSFKQMAEYYVDLKSIYARSYTPQHLGKMYKKGVK